ncbi:FAD/NAD(P)-binding domain-containing protein [Karstenula rhodostoma CBS 690.94]|uniref:FAD/NAD(P)-binding domain-containing protein n=1 Tax=Karstenula rhodostoma CBS 690.94 TaxID=1392251 RepID=A0A9P4PMB6_9PLEO|nr:FAD/NAD(P)-binding domain-containing protein [Karstenula rhodostoma CBS 690.94]
MAPTIDALIIGGGPAGLTVALTLARQVQTAIVFDDDNYRNKRTTHMHMVLTVDSESPVVFREKSRENITSHYDTIQFEDTTITSVKKIDGGFQVESAGGEKWEGKKLVLATGVSDIFPDIEGYEECWARGIYHCLFCKGFEDRGVASTGVLAVDLVGSVPVGMHVARYATSLSKQVVIYTNGNEELASQFKAHIKDSPVFKVDSRKIKKLVMGAKAPEIILQFADGSEVTEGWLNHAPSTKAKGPFVEQLGLETTPSGDLVVNPPYLQTSVPNVFAAGDNSHAMKVTPTAQYTGSLVGAGLSAAIIGERLGC